MDAVRTAITCAVVALAAGSGLSRLSPDTREGLLASARAVVGGVSSPNLQPSRPPPPSAFPAPVPVRAATGGEVIRADPRGQYQTAVEIEGERLSVLVDTGATLVALSFEDADRLGIRPMPADFRVPISTANGLAYAAPVRLRAVRLGGIEVRDVQAIVAARGQMSGTLLGMSFLSRLSSVAVERGELVLRQ